MSLQISNHYDSSYYVKMSSSAKNTKNADANFVSPQKNGKEYYNELSGKYPNLNITTGVYQAGSAGGSGFGNVMIHPDYLRKAANDPVVSAELEKNLGDIPAAERWLADNCRMSGSELTACGVVIDENGEMSSWSMTRRTDDKKGSGLFEHKKTDLSKELSRYRKNRKDGEESKKISVNYMIENREAAEITDKKTELKGYGKKVTQYYEAGKYEILDSMFDTNV